MSFPQKFSDVIFRMNDQLRELEATLCEGVQSGSFQRTLNNILHAASQLRLLSEELYSPAEPLPEFEETRKEKMNWDWVDDRMQDVLCLMICLEDVIEQKRPRVIREFCLLLKGELDNFLLHIEEGREQ